ncbi:MAG TPA: hypothetical protein VIK01_26830 [Polyangiaceae bacterium]
MLRPHTLGLLGLVSVAPPVTEYWQDEVPGGSGPAPPALVLPALPPPLLAPPLSAPALSAPPMSAPALFAPPLSAPAASAPPLLAPAACDPAELFAPAEESPASPAPPLEPPSELEHAAQLKPSVATEKESKNEYLSIGHATTADNQRQCSFRPVSGCAAATLIRLPVCRHKLAQYAPDFSLNLGLG